jgi:hypothetical protein
MLNNKKFKIINDTTKKTQIIALCPACYSHLYACNEAFEQGLSFYTDIDQSGDKACARCNYVNHN